MRATEQHAPINVFVYYRETLIFYDGVQLFWGETTHHEPYLCVLINEEGEYLCTGISHYTLALYQRGDMSLHEIFSSKDRWYYIGKQNPEEKKLYHLTFTQEVKEEWIPDE